MVPPFVTATTSYAAKADWHTSKATIPASDAPANVTNERGRAAAAPVRINILVPRSEFIFAVPSLPSGCETLHCGRCRCNGKSYPVVGSHLGRTTHTKRNLPVAAALALDLVPLIELAFGMTLETKEGPGTLALARPALRTRLRRAIVVQGCGPKSTNRRRSLLQSRRQQPRRRDDPASIRPVQPAQVTFQPCQVVHRRELSCKSCRAVR